MAVCASDIETIEPNAEETEVVTVLSDTKKVELFDIINKVQESIIILINKLNFFLAKTPWKTEKTLRLQYHLCE